MPPHIGEPERILWSFLKQRFEVYILPFPATKLSDTIGYDDLNKVIHLSKTETAMEFTGGLGMAMSMYLHHHVNPLLWKRDEEYNLETMLRTASLRKHPLELDEKAFFHLLRSYIIPNYGAYVGLEKFCTSSIKQYARDVENDLPDTLEGLGTREGIRWYLQGQKWLPSLARITTSQQYREIIQESGMESLLTKYKSI